jgi:hypothetical protein
MKQIQSLTPTSMNESLPTSKPIMSMKQFDLLLDGGALASGLMATGIAANSIPYQSSTILGPSRLPSRMSFTEWVRKIADASSMLTSLSGGSPELVSSLGQHTGTSCACKTRAGLYVRCCRYRDRRARTAAFPNRKPDLSRQTVHQVRSTQG